MFEKEAEAEADKVIIGSGMDRASVIHLKHLLVTMYIQGAEPREKQIEELEAQIEKMKCCSNCNHCNMTYLPYWCDENNSPTYPIQKCDKWEIKEND